MRNKSKFLSGKCQKTCAWNLTTYMLTLLNIFGPSGFYKFTFLGTYIYIYIGNNTRKYGEFVCVPMCKMWVRTRKYRDKETNGEKKAKRR